ncbi:hypothetical protein P4C99_21885, partial [Pontiellaceae bacterium B1224]|nr:hypothetical protein [Pontiellaceae bacterium B1224]
MNIITFQPELRPALPCVFASKDYREFRAILIEMDRILAVSGLENRFILRQIKRLEEEEMKKNKKSKPFSLRRAQQHGRTFRLALRYGILLAITTDSFRKLSRQVADSLLFQWFTHTSFVDGVRPVSKSTLERFEKLFPEGELAILIHELTGAAADEVAAGELLYRETALRFDAIFADSTCVKANIHYPVDWVLLRDATRTLIGAITHIRTTGLRHRISPPETFIREMNKLCIEMTHTRKKKDGKKVRKKIFRRMKKLMKTVERHARNYYTLLEKHWTETSWSELETQVVLDRIQNILDQLPQAVHQAHERIIGERRVANSEKILSFYEPDVHVLVRGKADAETEFGNGLYLAEQADGLIVDWKFIMDQPPSDSALVKASVERITENYGTPRSYTGDRGFDAAPIRDFLEEKEITNGICPRSVPMLKEQLEDEGFCQLQKRRGSTEGRIGLFKNAYLGRPLRSKGYTHRKTRIEWCILGHNLWKLA